MKKGLSRSYLYLLLFVIVAVVVSLSLVRIIDGFEGQLMSTGGEYASSVDEN